MTVAAAIRQAAERYAARTALVECPGDGSRSDGRRISYGELYERTIGLCAALEAVGISRGARLAVLLDNSIEMVVTEWVCLLGGYVWVALNTRSSADEIAAIVADSSPAILVVAARYEHLVGALDRVSDCRLVMLDGGWDDLIAPVEAAREPVGGAASAPVRIRYTSGTSGRPKGAVLPRRSYDASLEIVSSVIGPLEESDVLVQVAPMTHAAGAMLLPHAAVGARALLVERFDARAFIDLVARERATSVFLVPTMLVRVLDALDDPCRLSTLKTIVYGGASMPVEPLAAGIERLGARFVQIYGLTESTWPVTALGREDHLRRDGEDEAAWRHRLGSCGRPTPIGELRIVDEHGREVGVGEIGELWVRGRNTMTGYWKPPGGEQPDDAKGLDVAGWMHTGDLGWRDAEGYVTIVDRLGDMIVSGGFNVYPREVEDALCSHPAVLEAAVVGRPSAEWGETVHAAVVLKPGASVTSDALVAHCAMRIASYKKPRSLEIVESLPRNASGKTLRRLLRA